MRKFTGVLRWVMVLCISECGLKAASAPDDAPLVQLPPLVVSAALKESAWRYTEIPGLHVLSNCSDRITREFILATVRAERLLDAILPREFQAAQRAPDLLILSSTARTPSIEREVFGREITAAERGPAPQRFVQSDRPSGGASGPDLAALMEQRSRAMSQPLGGPQRTPRTPRFLPNLRLADIDYSATFALIDEANFNANELRIASSLVQWKLENRIPRLPAWFIAGFSKLYDTVTLNPDRVNFAPLAGDPGDGWRILIPLKEVLEAGAPPAGESLLWESQGALLVRWALDPTQSEFGGPESLWRLVRNGSGIAPAEIMARESFGLGISDLHDFLGDYLRSAARKPFSIRVPPLGRMPGVMLRKAGDGEVAWIRGEWARLAARHVAEHQPEFAARYAERAASVFAEAADEEIRDPRYLAAAAFFKLDRGETAGVKELLESAIAAKVDRPRLEIELARLRPAEAQGGSTRVSP